MANTLDVIRDLVAKGQLREAGKRVATSMQSVRSRLLDEAVTWRADLRELETLQRRELVDPKEHSKMRKHLALKLLDICRAYEMDSEDGATADQPAAQIMTGRPSPVFLSYNHQDAEAALAVRSALEDGGIGVEMDIDAMKPGEPIKDFIHRAIGKTSATVCVLSRDSLISEWVALETLLTLLICELWQERRFVACFLDESFLDLEFRLDATRTIDDRIAQIDALIPEYAEKKLNTNDLNTKKSRLYSLRNGLGDILAHLRDVLSLDIRIAARADSLARLVAYLSKNGSAHR